VFSRRHFLSTVAVAPLLGQSRPLKIGGVEITRLEGHRGDIRAVSHQHQVNPLHVYEELRPAPYRDGTPTEAQAGVSALYLRIKTDQGPDGLYGPIDREAAIVVQEQLRPFLMGKDALAGEKLWDQMWRSNRHSRRGHFLMAISAVDNTLWDLRGRYFNTPVYRLLGGPTRTEVEAYASCLGYSLEPDKMQARARALKDSGFRYQKWFMAYGPGDGPAGMKKNVEMVRLLREAAGEETELMFDAYMGWDLTYALAWAKQVERYRPRWIEEAIHAEKPGVFAELRRGTSIPIASGEHIQGRWELYDYLKEGALSVVQCDPEWCGGVSELEKICAIATLFDVPVIPHGHSIHTALHVVASQSPGTCPLVEYLILKMNSYHHFEKRPPTLEGAHFKLPEAPGFGIELDPAKIEAQKPFTL
jgi:L-alanine-DL-glutamate epimerase-like enolase superfamily enzyme